MRLSRIKLPNINSLYGRIFAIFWFTMLLVLIAVLSLPHLDPRKARDIPEEHYKRMVETRDSIQQKYSQQTDLGRILFRIEGNRHGKH
ncbi:envelope stress sensor histidine kinase CpxA, partial [Vibrio parahaemolyticus]|nr:envelope stress sensor histidine kinase CpxA [Vibrio parahaemolyticus]